MATGHNLHDAASYYADDRNRTAPFDKADIDFVQSRIDPELLTAIGYRADGSWIG
jgi:hypothetical protein